MDQLMPVLINFLEEKARPHVQDKVTEEVDEAKVDMKESLPDQAIDFIKGVGEAGEQSGNALISMIVDKIGGDSLKERIKTVTHLTVDTASEGMDILMTNGIMNVARGVLTKTVSKEGDASGFNLDFLKSDKESMIGNTMTLSQPVIKQVSGNIGRKISSHLPAAIGGSIQEMIDSTGGSFSPIGMAAKLFMKVTGTDDDDDEEAQKQSVNRGGDEADAKKEGGHLGPIQRALQKLLAPKILDFIQPYMDKFEAKMNASLEGELRNKVFNIDYLKQTALSMITGASAGVGGLGGLLGAFMGGSKGQKGDDDEEGGGGGGGDAFGLIGNLAQNFLKNRG